MPAQLKSLAQLMLLSVVTIQTTAKELEATPEFHKMSINAEMTGGWKMATVEEVENNFSAVTKMLGTWGIAQLACGYKIDGSGYGNKILKIEPDCAANLACAGGEQIITRAPQFKFQNVSFYAQLSNGWRMASVKEVQNNFATVTKMLSYWGIAQLADGYKIDGQGYGNQISKLDAACAANPACAGGEQIITNAVNEECRVEPTPQPAPVQDCRSETFYIDESENQNRCTSHCHCDGARTCSSYNWCQGTSRPAIQVVSEPEEIEQPASADDLSSIEQERKRRQIEANLETPIVDVNVAVGVPNVVPNFIPAPKASVIVSRLATDSDCAAKCTADSIAFYWVEAAKCVATLRSDDCVTVEVPAKVAAFDTKCLKSC